MAEAKLHFFQISLATKHLHFKNICHKNLKPENMLLCLSDELLPIVKIKDMGLSKLLGKTRLSQGSTAVPLIGFVPLSAH